VVDLTDPLLRAAATLAVMHGLRTLDALHLAAADLFAGPDLRVLTWDRRLWRAANARGLATLPTTEP
jgi:predicted nucleic acid-binding protein